MQKERSPKDEPSAAMQSVVRRLYDAAEQPYGDSEEGRTRWAEENRAAVYAECRRSLNNRYAAASRIQRPL
jgi:hypothetical protein